MNRKSALLLLFLLSTVWCCLSLETSKLRGAEQPLNVVLILVDDLGWTDLGCYGSDFYQTPNIDKLAADGMRFTQNYSACNACSPTRAALLTGLYPARTHLTDWIPGQRSQPGDKLMAPEWTQKLEHKYTTLAEAMNDAGYATYHIGKWHLGSPGWYPEDSGFDLNIAGSNRGSPYSYHYPYKGMGDKWHSNLAKSEQAGLYLTDRLASEAVALIQQSAEKPFFMYLPFYSVHTPIQGRPDLVKKYKELPAGKQHNNAEYAAMVEAVDEAVGRVRAELEKQGIADRTLIVLNSDNGGLFRKRGFVTSNAPLRGGKGQQWEGGTRVPAIVHWPGVTKAGSVCNEQVITMDFYPTLLEITGVKGNDAHNAQVDGLSLTALLRNPQAKLDRKALYWHYPHYNVIQGIPHSIIRAGDYKLIEYYEDNHLELYDLAKDQGEQQNLVESQSELTQRLHQQLRDHLQAVGAQMPVPNPKYQP